MLLTQMATNMKASTISEWGCCSHRCLCCRRRPAGSDEICGGTLVAFAALTAFAISYRVFVGHCLLLELPMPLYIVWALGVFRSSGRFFWLIGYAQMAIVLIRGFRRA